MLLQRCLKNCGRPLNYKEKGSVQVVEFTYVFPIVVLTVLLLLMFIIVFSFYISSFYITDWAVETAAASVGQDGRLYWELSGNSISEKKKKKIENRLEKHLKRLSFIPSASFNGYFKENFFKKSFEAECEFKLRGKSIFKVKSKRRALKPVEFARNVDLLQRLEPEEGFLKVLEEKYGHVLEKDSAYEVF